MQVEMQLSEVSKTICTPEPPEIGRICRGEGNLVDEFANLCPADIDVGQILETSHV